MLTPDKMFIRIWDYSRAPKHFEGHAIKERKYERTFLVAAVKNLRWVKCFNSFS